MDGEKNSLKNVEITFKFFKNCVIINPHDKTMRFKTMIDINFFMTGLDQMYQNPVCELKYTTPFELLVAVILSAQCTDKRVNQVTSELFKKYNKPEHFATLNQDELENLIHSCGFYHNKAKSIISASKDIIEKFEGEVPTNFEELTSLAGVGRKTANVMVSEVFGGDAIAVDTHVLRVTNRVGFVSTKDPLKCEQKLMQIFPKDKWSKLHFQIVLFGRYTCKAMKPDCENCLFNANCPSSRVGVPAENKENL